MQILPRKNIIATAGYHLISERHIRVQVVSPKYASHIPALYEISHGEVLLNVLFGECFLYTSDQHHLLSIGDQVLLVQGDAFVLVSKVPETEAIIQIIWTPGLGGCQECRALDESKPKTIDLNAPSLNLPQAES